MQDQLKHTYLREKHAHSESSSNVYDVASYTLNLTYRKNATERLRSNISSNYTTTDVYNDLWDEVLSNSK